MARPELRALLVDLSGTLHIGDKHTPAAANALRRVKEAGIAMRFCSNTSKESTKSLRTRLNNMGFELGDDELWTSLGALKDIVRERVPTSSCPTLRWKNSQFSEYNSESSNHHHSEYDSVIVGLSPSHFNYDTLTKAFRILSSSTGTSGSQSRSSSNGHSHSPPLIATHRAKYIRTPDGELSLGPGPFVSALEDAVGGGLRAESVGKPSRAFFERVLASVPRSGGESKHGHVGVAIIGDDIEADLGGAAVELGLWRVLVKIGKYRDGDEKREGQRPPDELKDSFASFVDDLLGTS